MFLIWKARGDLDLGPCNTSGLAFTEPQRNGKIRFFLRRNKVFFGSRHCDAVLQMLVPKLCTDLDSQSPLHFDIRNMQQIRTQNKFPIASRTTSAPSRSALADHLDLPVMLITRLSEADKKNRRGRSLSICGTQWPAGIEMRLWNILWDSTEILKGFFEKQEQFSKKIVFAKFDR